MKEYQKYLIELFEFKKPKQSPLEKEIIQWMIDNMGFKPHPHKDRDMGIFGTEGMDEAGRFFWIQPDEDGSKMTIIVNHGDYDFTVESIEDMERVFNDPGLGLRKGIEYNKKHPNTDVDRIRKEIEDLENDKF